MSYTRKRIEMIICAVGYCFAFVDWIQCSGWVSWAAFFFTLIFGWKAYKIRKELP
jgi:hypothetical protein